ncbi:MAG: PD-(D/E)XK nuclease family protein [Gammaproteobacteria bacterium]
MNKKHLELLDAEYTLVAANRRLARRLQYDYAHWQIRQGKTAWSSPDILHWQAWLQRCWDNHVQEQAGLLLLNDSQEQVLWQRIINESSRANALMQAPDMVKRVMEAWDLMHQYRLPVFPAETGLNEDARAFRNWADSFKRTCSDNHWCDSGSLLDLLAEYIRGTNRLALIGFDRITPRQQYLFDRIEAEGGAIHIAGRDRVVTGTRIRVAACANTGEEINTAAGWAREILEADTSAGIGIVIPDLQNRRSHILRRFQDCFNPGAIADAVPEDAQAFSLSLGKPLPDYPLVNTAFSLLALGREPLSVEQWGAILRSPWLYGAGEEELDRARLDVCLRDHGETRADIATLLHIAGRRLEEPRRPGLLMKQLQNARDHLQTLPHQARPGDWAGYISHLLTLYGWPGDRVPDSGEYQVLKAWREVLDRFVSLQLLDGRLTYSSALGYLRRIATAQHFQPETGEVPVQILGPAGAADMGFDHLWVAGLQEETWPPPARPNPYIPFSLQRRSAMPGATAEVTLEEARQTLSRLACSAQQVVLSYPENEKERTLRPSPLLKPYMESSAEPLSVTVPHYAARILAAGKLETFSDERAPPPAAGGAIGGTALFRDQSVCPFRAFARHRLHAGAPEEVDIGLSPRDRGLLLHRALHLLWQRLHSQEQLCAMDPGELERLLASVTDEVIQLLKKRHPRLWTERFTGLEKARLIHTLRQWLQQERQRAPFIVVAGEEAQRIRVEGVEVNTRIDRIDRLADGREVIIDYKTGEAGVNEWLGERPDDPQLPLYAVTRDAEVAAVAFGRLKRGRGFGYQGLASEDGILPATKAFSASNQAKYLISDAHPVPEWSDLLASWRGVVAGLARGFLDGDARVDPKDARACRYCDQHPLCRIHELPPRDADDDD